MKLRECDLLDEMFSHLDPTTGIARTFNVTAMKRYAQESRLEILDMPITPRIVRFVRESRGIEQPRVDRLREPYLSEPLIAIEFGDKALTVDGHHRIVKRFTLGMDTVQTFFFRTGQWERFVLDDVDNEISKRLTQ